MENLSRRTRSATPHKHHGVRAQLAVPNALLADANGPLYSLILSGHCLEPEVHDGDHAIVAPEMPIRRGDFVVLWPKDKAQIPAIKRVIMAPPADWPKWRGECEPVIIVEQLNPPRRYGIGTSHLAGIHRVYTTFRPGTYERTELPVAKPAQRRRKVSAGAEGLDAVALGGTGASADPDALGEAAIEFEPIADLSGLKRKFDAAEWRTTTHNLGINLRISVVTLGKTKPELVEVVRQMDPDIYVEVLDNLHDAENRLKALAEIAASAHARYLVAGAVIVAEDETTDA